MYRDKKMSKDFVAHWCRKIALRCEAELLTTLKVGTPTPSYRAPQYGNYVSMWMELVLTGKLGHMERMRSTRNSVRKGSCRYKIMQQALRQYDCIKSLHKIARPSRDFMRIVMIRDQYFDRSNTFDWVDIEYLRGIITSLHHQFRLINLGQDLEFEKRMETATVVGRCDVYCPTTNTVVEIKATKFTASHHLTQTQMYARMLKCRRAFLCNPVDGGVWKLLSF